MSATWLSSHPQAHSAHKSFAPGNQAEIWQAITEQAKLCSSILLTALPDLESAGGCMMQMHICSEQASLKMIHRRDGHGRQPIVARLIRLFRIDQTTSQLFRKDR